LPAILYFFTHNDLQSSKIGIAQVGSRRIAVMQRHGWRLVVCWQGKGRNVLDAETALKRILRKELKIPQHLDSSSMPAGGQTETFASTLLSETATRTLIQSLTREFSLSEVQADRIANSE
jgi:hypothetical protein